MKRKLAVDQEIALLVRTARLQQRLHNLRAAQYAVQTQATLVVRLQIAYNIISMLSKRNI